MKRKQLIDMNKLKSIRLLEALATQRMKNKAKACLEQLRDMAGMLLDIGLRMVLALVVSHVYLCWS